MFICSDTAKKHTDYSTTSCLFIARQLHESMISSGQYTNRFLFRWQNSEKGTLGIGKKKYVKGWKYYISETQS